MPFIDTKTNVRVSEEKEAVLKQRLGEAIASFPGKSEYWLMMRFEDDSRMWFRGHKSVPMAMVDVKLFGGANEDACARMTKTVCALFEEVLGIKQEHVYVNYTFSEVWGWNGENF